MMYNSYPNFYDSYYFLTLPHNPIYFTYDPLSNSIKTSSNIILIKDQTDNPNKMFQHENDQFKKDGQCKKLRNKNKQKQHLTQKQLKRIKSSQKQVFSKKQKRITKPLKKIDIVQKQGRNSHSNILRKFFKLLSLESQFFSVVQRIINKFEFDMKVEYYFNQVKLRGIDHRNYIRVKEVQSLFEYNNSPINKITRTLFQNYLKNYYIEHLLSSKKTDNKSIVFHLKGKRSIAEQILYRKSMQSQERSENISDSV